MLFNSIPFLFVFLPVLLLIFYWLGRTHPPMAAAWLLAGSLFFYGWWNTAYLGLLLTSIIFNYCVGFGLTRIKNTTSNKRNHLLAFGVIIDLVLLGYYKYANFFIETYNTATDSAYTLSGIILPLGISFFTFTQIAFLVDAARGEVKDFNLIRYGLFVTYFPHLIAGPILHHKEMMPQFSQASSYRPSAEFLTVGLTIFALGLFKKVVLADGIAPYASSLFSAAEQGQLPGLFQAWGGALAYTLQLYFDFSGYSDMAIGLSYMIGIRLPLNFNSPYKAANITDFWRRWHMTLSRFLRDYLYIPLGGNRHGTSRKYINLFATMLLGGLWHGAGWNFVIWGGLHGVYLIIHQGWQTLRLRLGHDLNRSSQLGHLSGVMLTFLVVVIGWVFFRAQTTMGALHILQGMVGLNGIDVPDAFIYHIGSLSTWLIAHGITFTPGGGRDFVMNYVWVTVLLPIVFLTPNTQQLMSRFHPALGADNTSSKIAWGADWRWVCVMTLVLAAGLLSLNRPSEFLYFQF